MKRPCTLQDIADQIGCARNTVSMALRDSTRISLKRRRRVKSVAKKMGYVPNLAARNLKTQRSGLIGIYAESARDDVRVALINSLVTQLHTTQSRPILGIADSRQEDWITSPWLQSFLALNVEALVVVTQSMDAAATTVFKRVPSIVVGCAPVDVVEDADRVALDRFEAGQMGVEHLLVRGKTRICIAPRPGDFAKGCLAALRAAGLKPCGPTFREALPCDSMAAFYDRVLAARPRPTGVLLGDSPMAAVFMRTALARGLRVPEDIAVVGYDYFAWADDLKVPLTTIEQPLGEMASQAISLVQRRMAEPSAPRIQHILPHHLVVRASS